MSPILATEAHETSDTDTGALHLGLIGESKRYAEAVALAMGAKRVCATPSSVDKAPLPARRIDRPAEAVGGPLLYVASLAGEPGVRASSGRMAHAGAISRRIEFTHPQVPA
jgi:hypothetical protein